jgi:hypothetical protein
VNGENSIIKDKVTNQFLAVVEGVSDLDATDFSSDIADPEPPRTFEFVDENGDLKNLYKFDLYKFNQQDGGTTTNKIPRSIFVKRSGTTGEDNLLFNKIPATAQEGRDFEGPSSDSDVKLSNGQRVVSFADGQGTASFDITLLNKVLGSDGGDDRFFSLQLRQDNIVVDNANFLIQRGSATAAPGGGFTFSQKLKEIGSTPTGDEGAAIFVPGDPDFIQFKIFRPEANADVAATVNVSTSPFGSTGSAVGVTDIDNLGTSATGQGDFLILENKPIEFGIGETEKTFQVPAFFDGNGSSVMQVALSGDGLGIIPTAQVEIL